MQDSSNADLQKSGPKKLIARLFTDKRLALMLALGFSSGLPFLLVFSTQSAWLREAGVAREHIGLMSWVALAYSFKFLWAPLLDQYDAPAARPLAWPAARLDGPHPDRGGAVSGRAGLWRPRP